ncbi:putative ArsR family transcriptional regulator OS=Ureibacillus acetophenoni OX=614649 GN=SAMN05877842_102160 PE=4 SV=1 [Ureibacillus acetophenoni]
MISNSKFQYFSSIEIYYIKPYQFTIGKDKMNVEVWHTKWSDPMQNLKVMSTLADETRYQIYQYVLQHKQSYTVQEIAEQFNIHPNVARLHLTKLSEIGIVHAEYIKSGKGGRPGRIYRASERGLIISFPKRDYERLLNWALQYISIAGNSAIESLKSISYDDGYNEMSSLIDKKHNMTYKEKIELLTIISSQIGYVPSIIEKDGQKQITFAIYNCPFKEQLPENAQIICACHESYLQGQIDVLFHKNEMIQISSMIHSCDECKYEINMKVSDKY